MKLKDIKKDITPLIETPRQIASQQFGLDNTENNIHHGKQFLSEPDKQAIKSIGEYTLWEFKRHYILIHNETNYISYYMQYDVKPLEYLNNRPCATQVVVWRSFAVRETEGITKEIFFNELLQTWKTVVTDSYQTPDGQRFWGNIVAKAMQMPASVYFLDLSSNKKIIKINNSREFIEMENNKMIWGIDQSYKNKLLLITTKPL